MKKVGCCAKIQSLDFKVNIERNAASYKNNVYINLNVLKLFLCDFLETGCDFICRDEPSIG